MRTGVAGPEAGRYPGILPGARGATAGCVVGVLTGVGGSMPGPGGDGVKPPSSTATSPHLVNSPSPYQIAVRS